MFTVTLQVYGAQYNTFWELFSSIIFIENFNTMLRKPVSATQFFFYVEIKTYLPLIGLTVVIYGVWKDYINILLYPY